MRSILEIKEIKNRNTIINNNSEAEFGELLEMLGELILKGIVSTDSLSQRFGLEDIYDMVDNSNYKAAARVAREIGCDMLAGLLEEILEILKKAIKEYNAAR